MPQSPCIPTSPFDDPSPENYADRLWIEDLIQCLPTIQRHVVYQRLVLRKKFYRIALRINRSENGARICFLNGWRKVSTALRNPRYEVELRAGSLAGRKFGRLRVIGELKKENIGRLLKRWHAQCSCGVYLSVEGFDLLKDKVVRCSLNCTPIPTILNHEDRLLVQGIRNLAQVQKENARCRRISSRS